jgi:hypothetical protein
MSSGFHSDFSSAAEREPHLSEELRNPNASRAKIERRVRSGERTFDMLYLAAIGGDQDLMHFIQRQTGESPEGALCLAAHYGNESAIRSLLKFGVNPNASHPTHRTAIVNAAGGLHAGALKILIEAGADLTITDSCSGLTPLIDAAGTCAARKGKGKEVIDILLAAGVDINETSKYNHNTALHAAAQFDSPAVIRFLLDRGASRDMRNKDGQTPQEVTMSKKVANMLRPLKGQKVPKAQKAHKATVQPETGSTEREQALVDPSLARGRRKPIRISL